jgi:hypothetical protein
MMTGVSSVRNPELGQLTGLTLSSCNLGKSRLDLRVERISGHDEDDGHVLINKREGSVLEFTSENLTISIYSTHQGP